MKYYQLISIFSLSLVSYCFAEKTVVNKQKAFEELNEIFTIWSDILTNPDIVVKLRNILYSYGSVKSNNTTPLNVSHILQLNITDPIVCLNSSSISSKCKCILDILCILENTEKQWALQMLDSDGKLSSGIFRGHLKWPGNYKECLNVEVPIVESNQGGFRGQYCSISWTLSELKIVMPITTGICLPDSCSSEEAKNVFGTILHILNRIPEIKNYSSKISLNSLTCQPRERPIDGPAIGFIFFLAISGLLMLIGSLITVYEYYNPLTRDGHVSTNTNVPDQLVLQNMKHESININTAAASVNENATVVGKTSFIDIDKDSFATNPEDGITANTESHFMQRSRILSGVKTFLKCFCVLTNGSKILNTTVSGDQLLCIHGIRFFSLTWVILCHTYFNVIPVAGNTLDVLEANDAWPFQVIMQGTLAVDSFFLLSGFLLTFLFLKEFTKREGKINWLYFYIHRYWRLTPAYMVILGFQAALFNYMGEGPFWPDKKTVEEKCWKNWWWNLLYINNFLPVNDMCIGWSWYLDNDMQFYFISPLFLYALYKWPKIGLGIVLSLLLSSWISTMIISKQHNMIIVFACINELQDMANYKVKIKEPFDNIYDKPYCRIGPFLIGVLLGYILYKTGDRTKFISPWKQVLCWCAAATCCSLSLIYILYYTYLSHLTFAVFNGLFRSSFALAVAWIIYACVTGHGGFINKFLSYKLWIPLSRLTYCAYLIHPFIIRGYFQGLETTLHLSHITMVCFFLAFLVWSYGVALVVSLAFESPMMGLEKLVRVSHDKES